ncbi:aminoglycoside adenylyltransferase domain-containing protein [Chromobacterium alticapitis]|uniref:aminoglycoside adenylyltransferase domain-containing protein n=1 Tax=Chromobacterium alticapitis TaxID=2073169 RepID=UPI0034E259B2
MRGGRRIRAGLRSGPGLGAGSGAAGCGSVVWSGRKRLVPVIARPVIRRAIADALPALIGALRGDERNVLLTLACMWRTLLTGEFVAKDVAADWAAARLPAGQAAVLAYAREGYLTRGEEDWASRRHEHGLTRTRCAIRCWQAYSGSGWRAPGAGFHAGAAALSPAVRRLALVMPRACEG